LSSWVTVDTAKKPTRNADDSDYSVAVGILAKDLF